MSNFKTLHPSEYEPISSVYLSEGRKSEKWSIDSISISEESLLSSISMTSVFSPNNEQSKFHLPVYAAMEFVSQLQIIFMHHHIGLTQKTREVWMLESRFKAHKPILDRADIQVEMHLEKIKQTTSSVYCVAKHKVKDSQGGHFEIWIKALMS